jgi:prepilin signal peptidase PulO-like enzyme (type II secretory pathway)
MQTFFYIILFIFWTLFWSFASVLIHRLYSEEWWILNGRSHCFSCKKPLKFYDLFPIFSFLSTKWKCRYCKKKIPYIYPILELSTGILFSLIWFYLIDTNLLFVWDLKEIFKLIFWLWIGFVTILYTFYDILFFEIHEWVMLFWLSLALLWATLNTFWINIISTLAVFEWNNFFVQVSAILLALLVILWLYNIMLKELSIVSDFFILAISILTIIWFKEYLWIELRSVPILSSVVWALGIFIFFYLQIVLSKWRALGGWDLRIWIMIWLLLWISYSFVWLLLTYLFGSIISLLIILYKKIKYRKRRVSTIVPFWPFMWIWFFVTILFLDNIVKITKIYF